MNLFVVRHAIAEDAAPGQADAARELTAKGVRRFKQSVLGLRALGIHFSRVLTSPWLRAAQTTRLLAPIVDGPTIATDFLIEKPRTELLALIAGTNQRDRTATAVVGHEPWLSELVAWLAFGDPRHGEAFDFKKGGMVWLDGTSVAGGMSLRAFLPPKVLRELR
jgi:phosphohistidine phosphatase